MPAAAAPLSTLAPIEAQSRTESKKRSASSSTEKAKREKHEGMGAMKGESLRSGVDDRTFVFKKERKVMMERVKRTKEQMMVVRRKREVSIVY